MKNLTLVLSSIALVAAMLSTSASANIAPPGFPNFTNAVNLKLTPSGDTAVTLTAKNSPGDFFFTLSNGGQHYDVKNGQFELTATFADDLSFVSGHVAINGLLWPDGVLSPPPNTRINLFSADIGEADLDHLFGSNAYIGFRTLASTYDGWAAPYAAYDESVYLSGFNYDPNKPVSFAINLLRGNVTATATTTVPIPAPLWLLAGGLFALTTVRRREEGSMKP